MKNKRIKFAILALIMLVPFLSACTKTEANVNEIKQVKTTMVEEKNLTADMEYSGNIEAEKETVISAKVPGQVLAIDVNIGDEIKKAQVLGRLTGEENFTARNSANSAYQNSLLNLKNTDYLMDQRIRTSAEALVTAKENLAAIKTADNNEDGVSVGQIEKLELSLESLEIKQQNLDEFLAQKEKDIVDNALSLIRQAKILANNSISNLYSINNKSLPDTDNNFRLDNNFVTKDSSYRTNAELKIRKAKSDFYYFEEYYLKNIAEKTISKEELFVARDYAENLLSSINEALLSMNMILIDAVPHSGLSSASISVHKTEIVAYINQIEGMLLSQDSGNALGIIGVRQAFDNLDTERKNSRRDILKQIEIAKNQLFLMQSTVNSTKDDLASQIKIAESQVKQAEATLDLVKQSKTTELQQVKTQSDMAKGNLNLANVNTANTILKAPYDGVVVERLVNEGAIVEAGTPILKIANINSYKLVVYVPERDIIKLKVGQEASLGFDSFPDEKIVARVERISPKSEASSKKVRVELSLVHKDYFKIGMYAIINFSESLEKKILVIPAQAVQDFYGEKQVALLKKGKIEFKSVELGEIYDDKYEVIKGLEILDEIVLIGETKFQDGEEVKLND